MSPEQTNPGEAVAVLGGETTWPGGEEEADPSGGSRRSLQTW